MKNKTLDNPSTLEHVCGIAAYHVSELMITKAPGVLKCGIHNPHNPNCAVNVQITIKPGRAENPIWDQCFIALENADSTDIGESVGNRAGARRRLMELYADVLRDIVKFELVKAEQTPNTGKLVAELETKNVEAEALDELVHNAKGSEASNINNKGLSTQVEYLVECYGIEQVRWMLAE